MLSSVSPVITGAEAASPQPTTPLSASIRTSTLSARRTSSPAMMTGLDIGKLTAIGSMVLICTPITLGPTADLIAIAPAIDFGEGGCILDLCLQLLNAGLVYDALEQVDFLHHPGPGCVSTL